MHAVQCLKKPEEDVKSLELELTDGCKVLCGYWDLNPGLLEEHPVLLTTVSSLWSPGAS